VVGGGELSCVEPAFISVDGGIPPLSTGAPLPDDWAVAAPEPNDNKPAATKAISFDLIMARLLKSYLPDFWQRSVFIVAPQSMSG